ncbi:Hypothetical protein FKW44_010746 [Caligus rogercresseyi]|uniref:Uncharacterized protein n=1 Tax=Caligus rogercresseyi TaxID=217165 RepID=A0A7T8HHA3_CALRO|nr:Hypothetical protein FKW44_010746 [Caligus rogercresseyi]
MEVQREKIAALLQAGVSIPPIVGTLSAPGSLVYKVKGLLVDGKDWKELREGWSQQKAGVRKS